ncbi:hypothetical protein SDJN03_19322, partial [Cucurbita argyrosperma subsp. sororia]
MATNGKKIPSRLAPAPPISPSAVSSTSATTVADKGDRILEIWLRSVFAILLLLILNYIMVILYCDLTT